MYCDLLTCRNFFCFHIGGKESQFVDKIWSPRCKTKINVNVSSYLVCVSLNIRDSSDNNGNRGIIYYSTLSYFNKIYSENLFCL